MRGEMKFMKRAGIFKASNVTFNPETCQAYSYNWWRFVDIVNGKVIFNNYNYSPSTCKHQSKVRSVLESQGVKIDFFVKAQGGLQRDSWKDQAVNHLSEQIQELETILSNPRRKKALDEGRLTSLNKLTEQKAELVAFINTIN